MIVLAALSAVGWGAADFLGGLARGRVLVFSILAVSELLGGLMIIPALAGAGLPQWNGHLLLACVAGVGVTVELGVIYYALSVGAAFITAPVGALGTALSVTVGLVGGDPLSPWIAAGLICAIAGGGLCAAGDRDGRGGLGPAQSVGASLLAATGVAVMQITLHAAGTVNPYWAAELEHLTTAVSAAAVVIPVAVRRRRSVVRDGRDRLLPQMRGLPLLALVAATGAGGDVAYAAASGDLSTVSAIASLYPIPTIALAFAVQRRRTRPAQSAGILLALAGALILSALS